MKRKIALSILCATVFAGSTAYGKTYTCPEIKSIDPNSPEAPKDWTIISSHFPTPLEGNKSKEKISLYPHDAWVMVENTSNPSENKTLLCNYQLTEGNSVSGGAVLSLAMENPSRGAAFYEFKTGDGVIIVPHQVPNTNGEEVNLHCTFQASTGTAFPEGCAFVPVTSTEKSAN